MANVILNYDKKPTHFRLGVNSALEGKSIEEAVGSNAQYPDRKETTERGYNAAIDMVIPHGRALLEMDDLMGRAKTKFTSFTNFWDYLLDGSNLPETRRAISERDQDLQVYHHVIPGGVERNRVDYVVNLTPSGDLVVYEIVGGITHKLGENPEAKRGESVRLIKGENGLYSTENGRFSPNWELDRETGDFKWGRPVIMRATLIEQLASLKKSLCTELTGDIDRKEYWTMYPGF